MEVDLLVGRNNRLYPIEIKATATVLPGHKESLNGWRALVGNRASEGIIVSMAPEPFNVKTCHVLPWTMALSRMWFRPVERGRGASLSSSLDKLNAIHPAVFTERHTSFQRCSR